MKFVVLFMKKRLRLSTNEKQMAFGMLLLGIGCYVVALTFNDIILGVLALPLAVIFGGLSFFFFFISPRLSFEKKIQTGIVFLSALLIFAGFLSNVVVFRDTIGRENTVIFIDMECPELVSTNTDFNFFVANSNLQEGKRVRIEFIGKRICMKKGETCEDKSLLHPSNFYLLYAGQKQAFNISLDRTSNKSSQFHINLYDTFLNKIYNSPLKCKYDEKGLLI